MMTSANKTLPTIERIQEVAKVLQKTGSGMFGSNKVFISRLAVFCGASDLEAFKAHLVALQAARKVQLARADLVEAMDSDDVADSEIKHLGTSYHFLRINF